MFKKVKDILDGPKPKPMGSLEDLDVQMLKAIGDDYLSKHPKASAFHKNQVAAQILQGCDANATSKERWLCLTNAYSHIDQYGSMSKAIEACFQKVEHLLGPLPKKSKIQSSLDSPLQEESPEMYAIKLNVMIGNYFRNMVELKQR